MEGSLMKFLILFLIVIVVLHDLQPCQARNLHFHQHKISSNNKKKDWVMMESLDRGTVPSSGPSTCTFVPSPAGGGSTVCAFKEKHFAAIGIHPRGFRVDSGRSRMAMETAN